MLTPKRQRHFKGFDDKIISMYGLGMNARDIQSHLQDMYQVEVSHELISNVTDAVLEEAKVWAASTIRFRVYPISIS